VSVSVHTNAKLDAICAAAVEMAYAAAREVGGDAVGAQLGVRAEAERVVATHTYAADLPGYAGWYWAVTVARASRAKVATVDEVGAAAGGPLCWRQPWLPWSERLRPGDLAPGDVLPRMPSDRRPAGARLHHRVGRRLSRTRPAVECPGPPSSSSAGPASSRRSVVTRPPSVGAEGVHGPTCAHGHQRPGPLRHLRLPPPVGRIPAPASSGSVPMSSLRPTGRS
jgi:hypothetical protein